MVGTVGRMDHVKISARWRGRSYCDAYASGSTGSHAVGHGRRGVLRAESERILEDSGGRDWPGSPASATILPDHAGSRLLRAAVARRRDLEHDSRSDGLRAPVVATRVGGNTELVDDGFTGRLCRRLIARPCASDPWLLCGSVAGAPARPRWPQSGRAHFSLDRMVDSYHQLYSPHLKRRSPSGASGPNLPSTES